MDSSSSAIELRITTMMPHLNEKQRRLFLAAEAKAIGHGGITQISTLSGVSRVTITKGTKEINQPEKIEPTRCRKKGAGRKTTKQTHPNITEKIQQIIEPHTKGKPTTPLLWTSKSTRNIATQLAKNEGINISHVTVADLLAQNGYSLQANRKDIAIQPKHPDRNAQFEYINKQAQLFLDKNAPVLSIDAKKKELLGNFKNSGKTYRKVGEPAKVLDHDFPIKGLGKAVPYGVYDVFKNTGFVSVGVSGDTAEFAVESLRKWWVRSGKMVYGSCGELLVTCDCGGSNGYRVRLWKVQLQLLANELGKKITVLHYPPGTSKWNKVEHRLFAFISKNWQGQPLLSMAVVVSLIGSTKTSKGLSVDCVVDNNNYERGVKVADVDFDAVNIEPHKFHGEWNYTISPQYTAKQIHSQT